MSPSLKYIPVSVPPTWARSSTWSTAENWPRKPSRESSSRTSGLLTLTCGAGGSAAGPVLAMASVSRREYAAHPIATAAITIPARIQPLARDRLSVGGTADRVSASVCSSSSCITLLLFIELITRLEPLRPRVVFTRPALASLAGTSRTEPGSAFTLSVRVSLTNADDRLSLASLGRVQGGDSVVEGRDVADVRPQSSVPHPLDDLTQLGTIGLDNEVDRQAVGGPRLGRPDDGHQCSSGSNQACGPLP